MMTGRIGKALQNVLVRFHLCSGGGTSYVVELGFTACKFQSMIFVISRREKYPQLRQVSSLIIVSDPDGILEI